MPDPNAKDPHTIIFNKQGIVFFTLPERQHGRAAQSGHRRHQARSSVPVNDSQALRHQVRRRRRDLGSRATRAPCLFKVDPDTLDITEVQAPARRHDGAPLRHRAGRHDLVREFGQAAASAGSIRRPGEINGVGFALRAALASLRASSCSNGAVWYNESGVRPDPLVRFDIATETFQSWAIHSGNIFAGIWRNGRGDARRQPAHPPDRHQPHHPGDAEAEGRQPVSAGRAARLS